MVSQKLSAIEDYLECRGSYQEIAEAYNVSHVTILNWVTQKDSLIAECLECARMYPEALNLSIVSEGESPTKLSNENDIPPLQVDTLLCIEPLLVSIWRYYESILFNSNDYYWIIFSNLFTLFQK